MLVACSISSAVHTGTRRTGCVVAVAAEAEELATLSAAVLLESPGNGSREVDVDREDREDNGELTIADAEAFVSATLRNFMPASTCKDNLERCKLTLGDWWSSSVASGGSGTGVGTRCGIDDVIDAVRDDGLLEEGNGGSTRCEIDDVIDDVRDDGLLEEGNGGGVCGRVTNTGLLMAEKTIASASLERATTSCTVGRVEAGMPACNCSGGSGGGGGGSGGGGGGGGGRTPMDTPLDAGGPKPAGTRVRVAVSDEPSGLEAAVGRGGRRNGKGGDGRSA